MRLSNRYLTLAAGITVLPMSVSANAGIGYFMPALPIVVLALIPAILLEAVVLRIALGLRPKRAFLLSLSANSRSTLYGFILGVVIDLALVAGTGSAGPEPTKGLATAMLVPFFLLSWWIEYRVISRWSADFSKHRVSAVTGMANVLSYVGMLVFLWVSSILPERSTMAVRLQINEALYGASSIKMAIAKFWKQNNRYPENISELGIVFSKHTAFSITLGNRGRILVHIFIPSEPLVNTKQLIITPLPDSESYDNRGLQWECRSENIPYSFLPRQCRSPGQ